MRGREVSVRGLLGCPGLLAHTEGQTVEGKRSLGQPGDLVYGNLRSHSVRNPTTHRNVKHPYLESLPNLLPVPQSTPGTPSTLP